MYSQKVAVICSPRYASFLSTSTWNLRSFSQPRYPGFPPCAPAPGGADGPAPAARTLTGMAWVVYVRPCTTALMGGIFSEPVRVG